MNKYQSDKKLKVSRTTMFFSERDRYINFLRVNNVDFCNTRSVLSIDQVRGYHDFDFVILGDFLLPGDQINEILCMQRGEGKFYKNGIDWLNALD